MILALIANSTTTVQTVPLNIGLVHVTEVNRYDAITTGNRGTEKAGRIQKSVE
jgi:hypothetical protein